MRKIGKILIICFLGFTLVGCTEKNKKYFENYGSNRKIPERYVLLNDEKHQMQTRNPRIQYIKDRQTGIIYLCYGDDYQGGLTPLLDENGDPVNEGPDEEYEKELEEYNSKKAN